MMTEPVAASGIPVIVPPDSEELEDPPGEWTVPEVLVGDVYEMRVHSKRTAYVWLQRGTFWARFYVGVHDMGLMSVDDPVDCPIAEVREKCVVVINGSDIHYSLLVRGHHRGQVMTNKGKKQTQPKMRNGIYPLATLVISSR